MLKYICPININSSEKNNSNIYKPSNIEVVTESLSK